MAEGLQERYGDSIYAARQALSALMTLGNDFQQFRRIWLADEDTVQVSKEKKFSEQKHHRSDASRRRRLARGHKPI